MNSIKETLIQRLHMLFCIMIISSLPQMVFSSTDGSKTEVPLGGIWDNWAKAKSLFPISAFVEEHALYIYNTSSEYDIHLSIINPYGETVWEETVPAAETAYIVIPVDHLESGDYSLILIGSGSNYLSGEFTRQKE